jgi:hypothetical protein
MLGLGTRFMTLGASIHSIRRGASMTLGVVADTGAIIVGEIVITEMVIRHTQVFNQCFQITPWETTRTEMERAEGVVVVRTMAITKGLQIRQELQEEKKELPRVQITAQLQVQDQQVQHKEVMVELWQEVHLKADGLMMTELLQLEQIQEEHHQMMYMLHQEETEEQQLGQLLMMNIEDHLLIQSLMKPSEEVQLTLREAQ